MSNNNNPSGLDKYGYDLTQAARRGELDPVIGREKQTRELMEVMCRRRKNNAVLLGEPGVGKTAVAEGLAQRIASGNVPTRLVNKRIITIDLSLMIAGTRYRGEFEARLRRVIDDAREDRSVILVIDEMHTLIGAGSAEGAMDAANILKPALARGELQCIGATTSDEYKKYIERDAALQRRFQPIVVPEPTVEETVQILKGLRNAYELYHLVTLEDEALVAAAQLSSQYIADRFLPDKAIDLMDQSGARANLGASAQSPMAQRVELQRESLRVVELLKTQALRLGEINAIEPLHQLEKAWYTQLLRYQYVRKQIDPHEDQRLAKDLEERDMTLDDYKKKLYKDVYGEIKREATLRLMKDFETLFLTEAEHYLGIFEAARIRLHTQSHGILQQLGYGYNPNFQNYNPEVEYTVEFDQLDLQTFSNPKEWLHAEGLELEQALDDQLHDADIITSWPSAYFRARISKEEDEAVTETQLDRAILEAFQIIYRTRDPLRLGLDFIERRTVRALVYQVVEKIYPKKTAAYVDSVERKISILIHKQLMSVNAKNIQGAVILGFAESMKNPTKFPDKDLVPVIQEFAKAQYKKLKRREGHPVLEARKAYNAESLGKIRKELQMNSKSLSRKEEDSLKALAAQKEEAAKKTRQEMKDFFANTDLFDVETVEESAPPQKGLFPKFFSMQLDLPFPFKKEEKKKKKKKRVREEDEEDFLTNRPSNTLKDVAERYVEYVLTFKESPIEDVPGALLSFNPISEKDFFFDKNSITDIRRSLMAGEVSREEMQDRLQRHYNLVYEAATKHYLSASKYNVEGVRNLEYSDDLMDLHVEEEAMGEQLRAINEKLRVIIGPIVKPRKKKILKEDLPPVPDPSREEVKKTHDPLLTRDFLEYLREKLGTSVSESVFDRICVELGNPTELLKTQNVMADDPEDLAKLIQEKEAALQYGKPHIRRNEIAQLIADFTGIPVMDVSKDEAVKLQNLENILHERVIGQQEAIYAVSSAVRRARVGISNPNRPIASFVFCGPTGVGKTELTKALAAHMFGSEDSVIRLDMSEYMEKHTISQMIGSPPGYIGFGEGGQLTEKVRRRPYSVVLFDEIEKAHPDILDLLLQLLDDGRLTDAQGRVINFKNTIVILTSNIGSHIVQAHIEANPINEDEETSPKPKESLETDRPSNKKGRSEKKKDSLIFQSKVGLKDRIFRAEDLGLDKEKEEAFIEPESKHAGEVEKDKKEEESYSNLRSKVLEEFRQSFRPEFLNRLDELIVFRQLTKKEVRQIADIMVNQLSKRIAKQGQTLSVTEKAKDKLLDEGYDPIFGARPMRRAITKLIENGISEKLLAVQIEEGDAIFVDVDAKGDFQFVLTKKAEQDAKKEKEKAAKKEQVQPKPSSEPVTMKVDESVKADADTTQPRVVVDA